MLIFLFLEFFFFFFSLSLRGLDAEWSVFGLGLSFVGVQRYEDEEEEFARKQRIVEEELQKDAAELREAKKRHMQELRELCDGNAQAMEEELEVERQNIVEEHFREKLKMKKRHMKELEQELDEITPEMMLIRREAKKAKEVGVLLFPLFFFLLLLSFYIFLIGFCALWREDTVSLILLCFGMGDNSSRRIWRPCGWRPRERKRNRLV
mgnify:CR=1 FL=1